MARQVSDSKRDEVKQALREGKQIPSGVAVSWGADGLNIEMIDDQADIKPQTSSEGEGANKTPKENK